MSKGKHRWKGRIPPPRTFKLIDQFTLSDIRVGKQLEARIREFHWRYYADLALKRSEVRDKLHQSLMEAALERREIRNWQRVVGYQWCLKPLSAGGSLGMAGGRFNIGKGDPERFPAFPALYLSEDFETAASEALGQGISAQAKLTAYEQALASEKSFSRFTVSGHVETVIDLDQLDRLKPFIDIIKDFEISPDVMHKGRDLAKIMKQPLPNVIKSLRELEAALFAPNWRELPVQLGVPSTSQIFGQLVYQSGVEAIQYPSKFTGRPCLAIFPELFAHSPSIVALNEDTPPRKDVITQLDRETYTRLCR
jgi:hypothetical protein